MESFVSEVTNTLVLFEVSKPSRFSYGYFFLMIEQEL